MLTQLLVLASRIQLEAEVPRFMDPSNSGFGLSLDFRWWKLVRLKHSVIFETSCAGCNPRYRPPYIRIVKSEVIDVEQMVHNYQKSWVMERQRFEILDRVLRLFRKMKSMYAQGSRTDALLPRVGTTAKDLDEITLAEQIYIYIYSPSLHSPLQCLQSL